MGHQAALLPGLRLRMRPLGFAAQALSPLVVIQSPQGYRGSLAGMSLSCP